MTVGPRVERLLSSLWFRALFAILCLAIHVRVVTAMATQRFGATGFDSAPTATIEFNNPKSDREPANWKRLAVARWDSGHYIGIALRGYTQCPQSSLRGQTLFPYLATCDLAFFPAYSMIGRFATFGGKVPIDYALFGVSLVSSFIFMMLWTSRAITSRFGVGRTFLALVLFNTFTSGFTLVGIQTEPVFLVLTLGSFVMLSRRWILAGAILAGAASGIRVSGAASAVAYGVALLALTLRDPPSGVAAWARGAVALLLPSWGFVAQLAYFRWRFGDPFVYFRAHSETFHRELGFTSDPSVLLRALDYPIHEAVWTILCILLFLIGHREALRRFDVVAQAFFYVFVVMALGIPILGTYGIGLTGMTRYLLHSFPIFFAMAAIMAKRPAVLVFWVGFCVWHYWQVDLCFYSSGPGDNGLRQCHEEHWVGFF